MQILDFFIVRNDARGDDQLFFSRDLLAVNHRLRDLRHLAEQGFNFLRIDIFAVLRYDNIFASAGDVDEAVLVHKADVAGVEPAVLHDRSRRFRVLIVAQHDRLAADEQLALTFFIRILDLDFITANRLTGRTYTRIKVRCQRRDRRGLRQPVTLQERKANIHQPLADSRIDRCRRGNDDAQLAAETFVNILKYFFLDIDTHVAQTVGQADHGFNH